MSNTPKMIMGRPIQFRDDIYTHFTSSLMAGLVATTVASPMDVVKTRMMNNSDSSSPQSSSTSTLNNSSNQALRRQRTGLIQMVGRMVREEGLTSLFKGWVPAYSRLGPQTILTFVFLEQLKQYYQLHWSPKQ
jgi:dicarboxylate transporter 10